MLTWPDKDPNEVLDYEISWVDRLVDAEAIVTSTFTVTAGSVEIESSANASGITLVWLSGGEIGDVCEILNRIVTDAGRTYDQSVRLRIRKH